MMTTTEQRGESRRGPVIIEGAETQERKRLENLVELMRQERVDDREELRRCHELLEDQAKEIERLRNRRLAS